jgi:LmbE family N-acetylglucosaminyl deacetylase
MKMWIYRKIKHLFFAQKIKNVINYLKDSYIKRERIDKQYSALVLSPHQDDEVFGCGGTIKLISDAKGLVDVVYITSGQMGIKAGSITNNQNKEDLIKRRNEEAQKACKILGIRKIYNLNGTDTELHHEMHLYKNLTAILAKNNYDIIFCPWKYDQHPDHISTFNLLRKVLVKYPIKSEIWLYEVWTPVAANKVIDISTTITHKLEAAKMYVSQNECIDYYQKFSALAKYRSIHIPPAEFAEAFLCGDRKFILSL